MNKTVTVKAPATSANLGGGFDCLGVALELYHTVTVGFSSELVIDSIDGKSSSKNDLLYRSVNAVFKRFGKGDTPVGIVSRSDIPRASGLGSSAACIVAGVMAANALLNEPLTQKEMINICAELDGHPDNILPAIVGGVTAAYKDGDGIGYLRADVPSGLVFAVATPGFKLKTEKARAALPDSYSRSDCVYSLSRAVVTFGAFALGKIDMLKAVDDRLHQPYRAPLINGYADVKNAVAAAGAISSCISGAGPTVIAFFDDEEKAKKTTVPDGWTLRVLRAEQNGAELIR
ncbi:MAG: homoserine kinase [Clostridiales bacterium]|nr:homoserine kinase [Clostridiales bacterium]